MVRYKRIFARTESGRLRCRDFGLIGGLEAALTSPMVELISGIYICTDNQLGVYQTDLVKLDLRDLKRQLNVGFKKGEGQWFNGLQAIWESKGNEKADIEAKG